MCKQTHSEPIQTSKLWAFCRNSWRLSILGVKLGSECTSERSLAKRTLPFSEEVQCKIQIVFRSAQTFLYLILTFYDDTTNITMTLALCKEVKNWHLTRNDATNVITKVIITNKVNDVSILGLVCCSLSSLNIRMKSIHETFKWSYYDRGIRYNGNSNTGQIGLYETVCIENNKGNRGFQLCKGFHLIPWCRNFTETHSFCIVSGDSPKIMRKQRVSPKFPHHEINLVTSRYFTQCMHCKN